MAQSITFEFENRADLEAKLLDFLKVDSPPPPMEVPKEEEPAKKEPAKKEPAKKEPEKKEPEKKEPAKKEPAKKEPEKKEPEKKEPEKKEPETGPEKKSKVFDLSSIFGEHEDPPAEYKVLMDVLEKAGRLMVSQNKKEAETFLVNWLKEKTEGKKTYIRALDRTQADALFAELKAIG